VTKPSRRASSGRRTQRAHKALQLCQQIAQTLHWTLFDDDHDAILDGVELLSVAPGAHAGLIEVTVGLPYGQASAMRCLQVQSHLQRHAARLRFEVAASITRKRVPQLQFVVVGMPGNGPMRSEAQDNA
jgi:hypothetical protein